MRLFRKKPPYKLGKLPARKDFRNLQFAKYYTAPEFPPQRVWSDKVTNLGMMYNDRAGDCTFATSGHAVQVWTANNGNQIIIPDEDILKGYSDVSGYDPQTGENDKGCVELDVVKYLRNTGIGGHKIFAFTEIPVSRIDLIKAAINLFGCVRLCAALPLSAQNQIIWTTPKKKCGADKPGSWGGHSFLGVDYDETYVYIITWGKIMKVEWGWFTAYGDEVFAVLSMDWLKDNTAPNNFNLTQLQQDVQNI
jgi:hypothetical protein